ncbi:MAG: hypothetical protein AAGJ35_11800, partial [Myxococcota bacterium]
KKESLKMQQQPSQVEQVQAHLVFSRGESTLGRLLLWVALQALGDVGSKGHHADGFPRHLGRCLRQKLPKNFRQKSSMRMLSQRRLFQKSRGQLRISNKLHQSLRPPPPPHGHLQGQHRKHSILSMRQRTMRNT